MTEIEAIAIITEQFTGVRGFLRKLQEGRGVDREALGHVNQALDTLGGIWRIQSEVPKLGARPLIDIHSEIHACAHLYPGQEAEIWKIAGDLSHRIEEVFLPERPQMSEEEAAALVYGHFTGLPSLSLTLHTHAPLTEEWFEDLLTALEVLAIAWSGREDVPKAIAGPMLEGGGLIRGYEQVYPNLQDRWETLADEITNAVKHCLS